ncbi:unnamed protein product [Rhizophagus irregularis]|uniref:Uncharacterized protein n=1 Tax=Rhizophagus irregularis TaxID=588596 RepID=A0A2I1GV77_9GLOM|nr:hypothetical protein RhiirA4_467080 [Rhizophagus irregularis]CAB4405524.1 unnamed protein product [Rhizophagus irregularis]
MVKQLSTWLRSGVIDKNIKDNFRSTLNALYDTCSLKIFHRALRDSLHDNLYNDQVFRQESPANIMLYSSNATTNNVDNQINNNYINDKTIRCDSSPSLRQKFSFTDSEQGAFVEHIINLAKKAIYKFLVDNERNIPLNVVMDFVFKQRPPVNIDFSNADLLCMLNFIIDNINIFIRVLAFHGQYKTRPVELFSNFKKNVRNKMVHGIVTDDKGRWNNHSLQNVAILACEIIICVGGNHEDICTYGFFARKMTF